MNLLIVDDDLPTVDVVRHAIDWEAIGINKVEVAYAVAQAKRILLRGKTDIVISDIEMPQASGLDLLNWVRANGIDVEFLLLTCHERFDYAASAIKLDAVEYLTKPFNPTIMALSLQKTVARIKEKQRLREGSRYGEWRSENLQREEINFWLSLYNGGAPRDRGHIRREIEARGLPVDADEPYRLVVTRVADHEPVAQELGQSLLYYILENAHARHLFDHEENARSIRRTGPNGLWYFTAANQAPDARLRERCARVIEACAESAKVKATCCIGAPCAIEMLPDKLPVLQKLVERSVVFFGQAFTEDEAITADEETQVLEIDKLKDMLLRYDKVSLLNTLKDALASRTALRTLTERTLYLMQQELTQAVYAYLADAGVQAARLFADESAVSLSEQASRSSLDMIRWANYLIERTFAYEEEVRKTGTLVEHINKYIHDHFQEDIGRNEIAAEFHLAPEYLAKLYKKKTDQSLKDAIREYRVEQARRLLRDPEARVSDVAGAVGFDNFSYFSTVFKKETGLTPQEYQRKPDAERRPPPDEA